MFRQDTTPAPDPSGTPTVSAVEMARITGVGRERLRTWERRHGFPTPLRVPNGARRYHASDVRRVIAVARAVEMGLPVADAVDSILSDPTTTPIAASPTMASALEHCDAPAMALAGPPPLRVVWANGPTISAPEAPQVGAELLDAVPQFGGTAMAEIQQLMVQPGCASAVVEHRDWTSTFPMVRRSLAWRLPPSAAAEPTVVLLQLPDALPAHHDGEHVGPWLRAIGAARSMLRDERGIACVQRSLGSLVRGTGAIDAFLATRQEGRIRTATSVTGAFPARAFTVPPGSELDAALLSDEPAWLVDSASTMLGTPSRSSTLVVPLTAGGDRIGAAFLLYPAELALSEATCELLDGYGMSVALTLQREHLTSQSAMRQAVPA